MCIRRLNIKKLVTLAALIIFASFLVTCESPISPNVYDPVERPPKVNSGNDNTVTVYLDGSPPVFSISSRSLTKELAMFGHDYFEVTFVRPLSGGQVIARAAWEKGHAAGVSGVARGVDYRYTSVADANNNTGGATNPGAALLFVGKRSDRTLLGVGRLTGTDDGGDGSTFISANTKSVTFTVAALKGGADLDANSSGFLTGGPGGYTNVSAANTEIIEVFIGDRIYPLFRLDLGQTTYANYDIDFGDVGYSGIIRAAGGNLVEAVAPYGVGYHLTPRFPRGNGSWEIPPLDLPPPDNSFRFDINTAITWRNNIAAGAFQSPVQFSLNTASTIDGSIFAFSFEIPVYPLTDNDSRASGELWYIRPGFDSYLYDLDNGRGGSGGAILIGSGHIDQSLLYHLSVAPPIKRGYFDHPDTPSSVDWDFDLTGIIISLKAGNIIIRNIEITDPNLTIRFGARDPLGVVVRSTPPPSYGNITNIYDLVNDAHPNFPTFSTTYINNDTIVVYVEYYDINTSNTYTDYFAIYLFDPSSGGLPGSSEIPFQNRIVVSSWLDLINLNARPPGRYMILFYDNVDLEQINLSSGYTLIFLAARPNLTIGKIDGGGIVTNGTTGNIFYFGVWPYNEIITIGGNQVTSQPYKLNPAGSWVDFDTGTPSYGIGDPIYAPPNGSDPGTSQFFLRRSYANQTYTVTTGIVTFPNAYMEQFFSMPDGVSPWGDWDGNSWLGVPWTP